MTTCTETRDLLPLWAGGDLPANEAAALEAHLDVCPACREAAAAWREDLVALKAELGAEPVAEPPAELLAAAVDLAAARLPGRRRAVGRRRSFWAVAVPLAAVLTLAVWWGARGPGGSAEADGVSWPELQRTFAGCLEGPVPLEEWTAGRRAGVVTVLAPTADGGRYVVADCLEMSDLSRLRAYPWAKQRIATWRARSGDRLLVTVCPTGEGNRAERRRLRQNVLARFGPGV